MARRSQYDPNYHPDIAYKLTLLGAIDKELAEVFGVSRTTIDDWKNTHEEFAYSLVKGKTLADSNVAHSLYKLATGFEIEEEKVFYDSVRGVIVRTTVKQYFPPNPWAALNWLKNRQPELWREKWTLEIRDPKGRLAEIIGCTVEELEAIGVGQTIKMIGEGNTQVINPVEREDN